MIPLNIFEWPRWILLGRLLVTVACGLFALLVGIGVFLQDSFNLWDFFRARSSLPVREGDLIKVSGMPRLLPPMASAVPQNLPRAVPGKSSSVATGPARPWKQTVFEILKSRHGTGDILFLDISWYSKDGDGTRRVKEDKLVNDFALETPLGRFSFNEVPRTIYFPKRLKFSVDSAWEKISPRSDSIEVEYVPVTTLLVVGRHGGAWNDGNRFRDSGVLVCTISAGRFVLIHVVEMAFSVVLLVLYILARPLKVGGAGEIAARDDPKLLVFGGDFRNWLYECSMAAGIVVSVILGIVFGDIVQSLVFGAFEERSSGLGGEMMLVTVLCWVYVFKQRWEDFTVFDRVSKAFFRVCNRPWSSSREKIASLEEFRGAEIRQNSGAGFLVAGHFEGREPVVLSGVIMSESDAARILETLEKLHP